MCLIKCPKNCLLIRQLSNEHSLYLNTTVSSVFTPGTAKKILGISRAHFFTPLWCKNRIYLTAKFGRKKEGVKMGVKNEFTV